MILVIDNYDSFTFNIVQYIQKLGYEVLVKRNDEISIEEIKKLNPGHIIISPGPGNPGSAGVSLEVIHHFKETIPILGVCLGHQCIGQYFGGEIVHARQLYHGKTSVISHDGKGVFSGLPDKFTAARYHSLAVQRENLPDQLIVSAVSEDNEIMGIRHAVYPVEGVQFHPESVASEHGYTLLDNFIRQAKGQGMIASGIRKVAAGNSLREIEAELIMKEISTGEAAHGQIAALLTALAVKGESADEVCGFARVMRSKAMKITSPSGCKVIDTCGTGGDGLGTFNISTASAFVCAGAGLNVAKHGNRSVTSRCGSADVLEKLGVNINIEPEKVSASLEKAGIGFLFAQKLHGSMKHAAAVRKEIGIRTVFNILGPLTNPANARYQIVGVFKSGLTELIAEVLGRLGIVHGMAVHGNDGLDEITLCTTTKISEIKNGWIKTYEFDPRKYGFRYCTQEDIRGGDAEMNAQILKNILNGEQGPKRDIVILNAAAAIVCAESVSGFEEAISTAVQSINSGKALEKLNELIAFTNQHI